MHYFVRLGDADPIELESGPDGLILAGDEVDGDLRRIDGTDVWVLRLGDRVHRVVARCAGGPGGEPGANKGRWDLLIDGVPVETEALDARTRQLREMTTAMAGATGPKPVIAPMPGLVVKIDVALGDAVVEGQGVVIVEAMKMENELVAEGAGVVVRIPVVEGDAVEKGQVLVELEPAEGQE
jgi:pyruvate carboxylase subunit B